MKDHHVINLDPSMNGKPYTFVWFGSDKTTHQIECIPTSFKIDHLKKMTINHLMSIPDFKHGYSMLEIHWDDGRCEVVCLTIDDIKKAIMRAALS